MGDAQAIPANLYAYSDATSRAAQDLSDWIARFLTPAIERYQNTAIDLGGSIGYITVAEDGYLDGDVRGLLAETQTTDRHVHAVGEAFEAAASGGVDGTTGTLPSWIGSVPVGRITDRLQYATVDGTDAAVAQEEQAGEVAAAKGAKLAAKMNADLGNPQPPNGAIQSDLKQLQANEDDGSYAGAFLAGLDQRSLLSLLSERPELMVHLFMTALDQNTLTPATGAALVELMWSAPCMRFNQDFLTSLKEDPDAARTFFDELDQRSLNTLLAGDFSYPPAATKPGCQTVLFQLLLSTAQGISDPADLQDFFDHIGASMDGVTTDQATDIARDTVIRFVSSCMQNTVVAPEPGADLTQWFLDEGDKAGNEVEPWIAWLDRSDNTANANDAFGSSVLSDIVEGMITCLLPGGLLIGIGENLATTVLSNWLAMWAGQQGSVPDYFPSPLKDAKSMARVEFGIVSYQAIVQLLGTGQIVDASGDPVPGTSIQDVLDHPDRYYVVTPDPVTHQPSHVSVRAELSSMAGQYDTGVDEGAIEGGS